MGRWFGSLFIVGTAFAAIASLIVLWCIYRTDQDFCEGRIGLYEREPWEAIGGR